MTQLVLVLLSCALIVAGVATWTVGGALVVAGVLLGAVAYGFDFELVDDVEDGP